MAQPEAHNFRLISHDTMAGFGNVGEGMSLQLAAGGRRIMWMAHECAPKNFTGVDVTDPTKPRELGRWWYPRTEERDEAPPVPRHPKFDTGCRAHNTNVYPERPDRAYVGYIDGGACVLDISDIGRPKLVGHWNPHPPFPGFTHTVMPLFDRDLYVVSDECVRTEGADWPKLVWLLDARREDNLISVSTLPLPPMEDYAIGGRYGAHNLHENR